MTDDVAVEASEGSISSDDVEVQLDGKFKSSYEELSGKVGTDYEHLVSGFVDAADAIEASLGFLDKQSVAKGTNMISSSDRSLAVSVGLSSFVGNSDFGRSLKSDDRKGVIADVVHLTHNLVYARDQYHRHMNKKK